MDAPIRLTCPNTSLSSVPRSRLGVLASSGCSIAHLRSVGPGGGVRGVAQPWGSRAGALPRRFCACGGKGERTDRLTEAQAAHLVESERQEV